MSQLRLFNLEDVPDNMSIVCVWY